MEMIDILFRACRVHNEMVRQYSTVCVMACSLFLRSSMQTPISANLFVQGRGQQPNMLHHALVHRGQAVRCFIDLTHNDEEDRSSRSESNKAWKVVVCDINKVFVVIYNFTIQCLFCTGSELEVQKQYSRETYCSVQYSTS